MIHVKSFLVPENFLYSLLIFLPIPCYPGASHASPVSIFSTSALAVIPLAGLMVKSTKHLAEGVGSGIGGFLNATVGIAAELIIAGIALQMGLHSVIRASIPGSFIGNVLLVLGLNILAGGFKSPHQKFKRIAAR